MEWYYTHLPGFEILPFLLMRRMKSDLCRQLRRGTEHSLTGLIMSLGHRGLYTRQNWKLHAAPSWMSAYQYALRSTVSHWPWRNQRTNRHRTIPVGNTAMTITQLTDSVHPPISDNWGACFRLYDLIMAHQHVLACNANVGREKETRPDHHQVSRGDVCLTAHKYQPTRWALSKL